MSKGHVRHTEAMLSSPRCGAKTRSGTPCQSPAVAGKKRCRMHGGAPGSGAPLGNKNALKHGRSTRQEREKRRGVYGVIRALRESIPPIEDT
jgi:hypothetical protein